MKSVTLKPFYAGADKGCIAEKMESQNQLAGLAREIVEKRRQPRFNLKTSISVTSRSCGLLRGETVDISESGISAMLKIEVPLEELVELEFTLPFGEVVIYAMVRQRRAFRYGFQFVQSAIEKKIIQATCRQLAVEQSLRCEL
jgi:hypothetical protein